MDKVTDLISSLNSIAPPKNPTAATASWFYQYLLLFSSGPHYFFHYHLGVNFCLGLSANFNDTFCTLFLAWNIA